MRVVIQRVFKASVSIDHTTHSSIGEGMLILLGIEQVDTIKDIEWLTNKITKLRIFNDDNGVMNNDIVQTKGEVLVVSQFTLHASTKKGNRPSYIRAASPSQAKALYKQFILQLEMNLGKGVKTGVFGAMMDVQLNNNGPVTLLIDTQNKE